MLGPAQAGLRARCCTGRPEGLHPLLDALLPEPQGLLHLRELPLEFRLLLGALPPVVAERTTPASSAAQSASARASSSGRATPARSTPRLPSRPGALRRQVAAAIAPRRQHALGRALGRTPLLRPRTDPSGGDRAAWPRWGAHGRSGPVEYSYFY
jgi:hypothetical protein